MGCASSSSVDCAKRLRCEFDQRKAVYACVEKNCPYNILLCDHCAQKHNKELQKHICIDLSYVINQFLIDIQDYVQTHSAFEPQAITKADDLIDQFGRNIRAWTNYQCTNEDFIINMVDHMRAFIKMSSDSQDQIHS